MVDTLSSFEKILYIIDNAIKSAYLNKIQHIILKQTWSGKTYLEIASKHNYEFEYIKSAGCELWKLLSKSLNENITKINFVQFMKHKINSTLELRDVHVLFVGDSLFEEDEYVSSLKTQAEEREYAGDRILRFALRHKCYKNAKENFTLEVMQKRFEQVVLTL